MISYNAKPMSIRMRSRCQYYSAEPMSNLTTLNIILHMISHNAKPMSIRMRSRCQYYSAKPMSKRMRSRCQDECETDVNIMRSRCQGECEADVKTNAKPMSRRSRSRCREGIHTRTRRMEVHTHTNKLTPNGNTQSDMFYLCLH